jgi:hypothetical protein
MNSLDVPGSSSLRTVEMMCLKAAGAHPGCLQGAADEREEKGGRNLRIRLIPLAKMANTGLS